MMTMNSTRSSQVSVMAVILIAAFMLLGSAQAQPQPSDEAIWQQFLEWLPSAPPTDGATPMINQYRSRLVSNGASTTEADRQRDIIRRMMGERPDGWRIMFDNIYSSSTPGFVTQPNALLISTVEGRKPGRALDVGMGQGRNAVSPEAALRPATRPVRGVIAMGKSGRPDVRGTSGTRADC